MQTITKSIGQVLAMCPKGTPAGDIAEARLQAEDAATKAKLNALIETTRALADAIKGLGQVPSGTLYAVVMARISLENYNRIIDILVDGKLVRRDPSHMLTWIGGGK